MQNTPASSTSEYISNHEEIAHLMGHPLGSLIYLNPINSTEPSEVDLFIRSLSKPILLLIYSNSTPLASSYLNFLNEDRIQSWKRKEPELEIYGLSTLNSMDQLKPSSEPSSSSNSQLNSVLDFSNQEGKVPMLSDSKFEFTNFLQLPTFEAPRAPDASSPRKEGKSLKNLVLLLRGGQITRLQRPALNEKHDEMARKVWEMLIPDEELA